MDKEIITVKLTKVEKYDTNKDGNPLLYTNKDTGERKPYKRILIAWEPNGQSATGAIFNLADDERLNWKVGDEVQIIPRQNGQWTNFDLPNKKLKQQDEFNGLARTVKQNREFIVDLQVAVSQIEEAIDKIYAKFGIEKTDDQEPNFPDMPEEEEVTPDEIPF